MLVKSNVNRRYVFIIYVGGTTAAETFLEITSPFGHRCAANNQAVFNSSVEASTAI